MIEGYTGENWLDYVKNIFVTKIESNIHYRTNKKDTSLGAIGIPYIIWKIFKKKNNINEYKFVWTETYLKFYFNGVLYKTVKDKAIIKDLNESPYHYPIMNLEIEETYSDIDYKYKPVFKIYDFAYIK